VIGRRGAPTRIRSDNGSELVCEALRAVCERLWYQGLSQAEVARLLDVDVRTVKNHWVEARLRLSEELDGRMPGS
jgi:DNA-directed RNA polymerase specialized sigma24 family protein